MKRTGYIYEKIYCYKNIKEAILKASLGKRERKYVKNKLNNIDKTIVEIQYILKNKLYKPSPYTIKKILDGANKKERIIYKPRFYPDQIIHWALILQIQDIMMKGMYEYTCGSVPGRGTSYGQKAIRKWLDSDYENTKYCLKADISKFYPSIDIKILKNMFCKKIKDKDCLWLIDQILNSSDKGLPIGNYTSQWFSNFFLQDLDHYIKEKLDVKYYIRYVDDIVLLGSNKKKLHLAKIKIEKYLNSVNLKIKDNWQIFPIKSRDIDFLGLRFYRNKTILRKRNSLRIRRRLNKIYKKDFLNYKDACAIVSYWGWIKRTDSYIFYNEKIKQKVSLKLAKERIKKHAKNNFSKIFEKF